MSCTKTNETALDNECLKYLSISTVFTKNYSKKIQDKQKDNLNVITFFVLMKLFSFFMAIYILTLTLVPCKDAHHNCVEYKTKSEITQNNDHNQEHHDACSPFCFCTCCNTNLVLNFMAPFKLKEPIPVQVRKNISNYDFSFNSNFFLGIWQPPKILC